MSRRVVVIGKHLLAVHCLGNVRHAGDEVVLAVADSKDEGRDAWQPSFRRAQSKLAGRSITSTRESTAGQ